MDFYKKVLDSMDRVSDSNERLAEYLDGVLNAKGLESFVSVTPHKDGYRLQIAGKYSPLYVDVYLDGEDLVLGGSQIGKLGDDVIKELATFLGIPKKEVGEKADRFASVIRYLIAHNHRPVDELAKVKDDGESDEVAEKVEEVFADFAAHAPEDRDVRHVDLVAYGTPITLRFQVAEKNKDRLDVYAAVDGDIDVEAERQYVGSDSIANKGRAVIKALMGGILVDLAGKAAVKEAEAEKKAAVKAGAFDADVLYAKIKEMHEDLRNLPAGAKQEIMAEVENAEHDVKLMFTPGEAEGSVAFIMDVDGKPHEIGEYLISNKMLPYFAVSDLLRVADKVLGIEVTDSCPSKVSDSRDVEAAIPDVLSGFKSGSITGHHQEWVEASGLVVNLIFIQSDRDKDRIYVSAEIEGILKPLLPIDLDDIDAAKRIAMSLYDRIDEVVTDSCPSKVSDSRDVEAAAPESALVPLSDAVNAMRNDRSIKTKVANVDYLGSNVSFILTRKVDKDKGLVHVYVRNGKGAPMTFVASYDLDGIGIADRMFHAGLKELGIEDACGKKADGVLYEVEDMDRLREAVGDTRVLEELIKWEDDEDINAFIRDLSRTVFGDTEEIEDSKDKSAVSDAGVSSIERMQGRVGRILAGEAAGPNHRSSYAVRSFGKDKTLASVTLKGVMDGDEVTGLDVSYIYTTPLFSVIVDEHYDIPAGDAPEKELGKKIDARMDELGKIAVDLYEGKIDEAKARELIGSPVEIDRDVVTSSFNMVRDAVASSPEEAELVASLEADGSEENVARVAKEWADTFGFKTMKGSDGKELMAFSYVNGESDEKPTQYSYKQRAWTRIQ